MYDDEETLPPQCDGNPDCACFAPRPPVGLVFWSDPFRVSTLHSYLVLCFKGVCSDGFHY